MGMALPGIVMGASALMGARQQKKAIERARREQAEAAKAAQARLEPYQEQGAYATEKIREGLDTGTLGGSFTPQDFTADPGYQFRLQQAEQAQDRLQAARGNLYSGQAIKEREALSQGLAQQAYEDAYNRWLQTQQNRYNQLSGQQNVGYGAAGGVADIDLDEGQQAAEATMARRLAQDQGTAGAVGAGLNTYNKYMGVGKTILKGIAGGGGGGGMSGFGGALGSMMGGGGQGNYFTAY
jgi:hypothetical protein